MTSPSVGADPGPLGRIWAVLWGQFGHLLDEIAKFGVVGGIAFVVDVGTFNLLLHWGGTDAWLYDRPLRAKVVSTILATLVAYAGNRFWTFRDRDRVGYAREYVLFFLLNGVGLAIALGCLAISHYLLGFHTGIADNISGNGVGLVLGTMFRFWAYRRWVFPEAVMEAADQVTATTAL